MALINCPECGKQISNQAKNCPECGCPINEEKPKVTVVEREPQVIVKQEKEGLFLQPLNNGCGCCLGVIGFIFLSFLLLMLLW